MRPGFPVDRDVTDRLQALGEFLGRQKVKVDERARPAIDTGEACRVYVRLLRSATSDRQSDVEFEKNAGDSRARPDHGYESYYARATRAAVLSHRDWLAANEVRHRMRLAWADFFTKYDLLLCPVAGTAAFPMISRASATSARWSSTASASRSPITCSGPATPARSISRRPRRPAGSRQKLPVGVQIVGPQYGDLTCLAFAGMLEREFQGFVPPPGYA